MPVTVSLLGKKVSVPWYNYLGERGEVSGVVQAEFRDRNGFDRVVIDLVNGEFKVMAYSYVWDLLKGRA